MPFGIEIHRPVVGTSVHPVRYGPLALSMLPKNSPRALSTILTAIATIVRYSEISITDHLSGEGGHWNWCPNPPQSPHAKALWGISRTNGINNKKKGFITRYTTLSTLRPVEQACRTLTHQLLRHFAGKLKAQCPLHPSSMVMTYILISVCYIHSL
jgi:hypothetical protein